MTGEQAQILEAYAAVAAVAVTLIGFGFVHRQLRLGRRAAEAQNHTAVYQIAFENYRKLIDAPHLRKYFYDGAPLPADDLMRSQVLAFAEIFCDFFEFVLIERSTMNRQIHEAWVAYMRDLLANSPALQSFVNDRRHQYTAEFLSECDSARRRAAPIVVSPPVAVVPQSTTATC